MSYLFNNQQHLNDVIFSGRNKSYGAYAIRSAYGSTILKSLSITTFSFCAVMGLAFYFSNRNNPAPEKSYLPIDNDTALVTVFDLKREEPEPPATASENPPATRVETSESRSTRIVDTVSAITQTVLNEESHPVHSIVTSTSSEGTGDPAIASGGGSSTGTINFGRSEEPTELFTVDTEPEFEGGLKALYKFISSNIRYPEDAVDKGKQGTVYVRFVVDERGKVERVSLQNNLGYGLDDEAKRVVSIIPDFKTPAKVKGRAVKVYFQLPIRFRLN